MLARVPSCLSGLLIPLAVHSELVLSEFTAARPIRIMPIGESITDDCSYAGAWRAPLQALLETNELPQTNMEELVATQPLGTSTAFFRLARP